EDPEGVEGAAEGLGLLPLVTRYAATKTTRRTRLNLAPLAAPWSWLSGRSVGGYEIRHGETQADGEIGAAEEGLAFAVANVLTGSASGIGACTAQTLAARGVHVVVADMDGPGASAVAGEIVGAGGSAIAATVDISDEQQVRAMVEAAVVAFGTVDILHNNAGGTDPV